MDEQLRDNVECLLRGRPDAPAPEFLERLEARLRHPAPLPRWTIPTFFVAATLLIALVTVFVWEKTPPPIVKTPVQETPDAVDGADDDNAPAYESFFIRGGIAVAVELTDIQPSPNIFSGRAVTSQKTTWKISESVIGSTKETSLDVAYLIVAGSRYLRNAELNPAIYTKGAKRIFLLAGPVAKAASIEVEEAGQFLDIADSPEARKSLEALAKRAAKHATRYLEIVALIQKSELADPVERGEIIDSIAKGGRDALPHLDAILRSDVPQSVRTIAWNLQQRIVWNGHADLHDRLVAFVQRNSYAMLRPVDSQMSTGRKAIDLADDCLRFAPRQAISWLIERLDNESRAGDKEMPLVCQNALCLLNEITDFSYEPWHVGQDGAEEHNAKLRQEWKAWWSKMRSKPEADWCFGLTAIEKAGLKRLWLPPLGEVETSPRPTPVLRDGDLVVAKKLGMRAVPFLLKSVCINPPRATLWETGTVEWNPTAMKLIEAIADRTFGDLNPEARQPDGDNQKALDAAKAWAGAK